VNLLDLGQVIGGVGAGGFYAHMISIVAAPPNIAKPLGEGDVTLLCDVF